MNEKGKSTRDFILIYLDSRIDLKLLYIFMIKYNIINSRSWVKYTGKSRL